MQIYKVFSDKNLSAFDKMVFAYLKTKAGRKKECWPCYETIMKECNIKDRNSLSRSIAKLQEQKHLFVSKLSEGKKRHNIYRFASMATPYSQKEFLTVEIEFANTVRTYEQNDFASMATPYGNI